jgi:hypothetical protein
LCQFRFRTTTETPKTEGKTPTCVYQEDEIRYILHDAEPRLNVRVFTSIPVDIHALKLRGIWGTGQYLLDIFT